MRRSLWLSALLCCATTPFALADDEKEKSKTALSVVKISATHRRPDLFHPWMKQDAQQASGTGVVIEGHRILTNAHVVQYGSQIFVQPDQSDDKVPATVLAIAPDIDLAVLTVADESFFAKYPPMPRSAVMPKPKDPVVVYGYPSGGESLSITRGVVSRIEFTSYYYDAMGLRVQIDAAINPGNSGGPALIDDKMVGIIFSRLNPSDNIGYIIPSEEIDLFLADVGDGHYDGKPEFRDVTQFVQNEAMRSRLKLGKETTGLMVWNPARTEASYPLKRWDVITKIGDHPLDNQGMVQVGADLRLYFTYYFQSLGREEKVPLEVFREGKSLHVDLPVTPSVKRPRLLPFLFNSQPSYLVWGPLVFSPATEEHLASIKAAGMAEYWFPFLLRNRSPLLSRYDQDQGFEGEQLVMVVSMLPHRLVKGYSDPMSCVVDEINGVKVRNLRHLATLLRDSEDEFIVISFCDRYPDALVLDREQVREASEEILNESGIRTPCSDDIKAIFEAKK